jgi:hypothetical protein
MSKFSKMSKKQKAAFMRLLEHTHECRTCLDGWAQVVFLRAQTFRVCPEGSELYDATGLAPQANKRSNP